MTYIEGLKKDVEKFEEEHNKAKLSLLEAYKKLKVAKDAYQKVCPHEHRKEVKINEPGGFDYKVEYHTDTYCEDCGIFLGRITKYGGFG